MSFDPKKYLSDENGLRQVCFDKVAEGANLDFKRESYGETKKIEACRDVASFANDGGPGYILIGVEEEDSLASAVPGITDPCVEETRLRDAISDRIEPRIDRIALRTIPLSNGKGVVVVEIPVCELNIYAVRVDKGRYEFRIRRDKKNAELSFNEIQYRLIVGLDSLRFQRKFEAIRKYEKVLVSPSRKYNREIQKLRRCDNTYEFRVESVERTSVLVWEPATGAKATIPYDLILTVYYDQKLDCWKIILRGYSLDCLHQGNGWEPRPL